MTKKQQRKRKTAGEKRSERQLAAALESQRELHRLLALKDSQHKADLQKQRQDMADKKMEAVTRLIHAIGQAQEAISRPLSMLLDSSGF